MIAGVALATAAITTLFKLFTNYWEFLDKKVIPAQAEFNKQIGGSKASTAGLRKEMIGTGQEFLELGYSFEEGAALIREFASGLRQIDIPKNVLKTGKELTAILGLTGEEAGKTIMYFQKQGAAIEKVNEMFDQGAKTAAAYGLPINDVLRDMGQAPDIMARFGIANRKEFAIATAKARSYGLSIKEVNSAFGKSMSTFSGASEATAKLNSVFGTTINSFQLMLEKNPVKRMEMMRKELDNQGKSWEKLSDAEKYVITDTFKISESQAAMAFSSEDQRKKLEKQAKQRQNLAKIDEHWNRGMGSIKKTLIAWGPLLDKVSRAAFKFVAKLLGFKSAEDPVMSLAKTGEKFLGDLTGYIDDASNNIKEFRQNIAALKDTWDLMFSTAESKAASDTVDMLGQVGGKLQDLDASKLIELQEKMKAFDGDEKKFTEILERKLTVYEGLSEAQAKAVIKKVQDPYSDLSMNEAPQFKQADVKMLPPKQAEVAEQKKAKKNKEEREKEKASRKKEMVDAHVEAIEKTKDSKQEIILRTVNGDVIGKGIIKGARGSK